jgi:hypothetical protein
MKKLFIEKVKLNSTGGFLCSSVVEATEEQIKDFRNRPCNHSMSVDKLIYDNPGYPYNARYCGVCGGFLDMV